ncbi:hypothetical protein V6N11_079885 [Hibiscus sabdariffa]|uniref:Uncharacterized protein n=1 Tax=Hibiscus sabdariffa TaxID=183260 RepID=A0ABR2RXA4_9ROSI
MLGLASALPLCHQHFGTDVAIVNTMRPASDIVPSTFSAKEDGSLWIVHGGQISIYDPYLSYTIAVRNHLNDIDITSICQVWPEIAIVGSESTSGLHIYNISNRHYTNLVQPRRSTNIQVSSHCHLIFVYIVQLSP